MFIDEFQDTDDVQIEALLQICDLLDYKMFVVGDIKQCIYRFRGAEEKLLINCTKSPVENGMKSHCLRI